MLVRTIRKPGDPGTRKLVQRYGERLVCIRYRYDPEKEKRYKTVELIKKHGYHRSHHAPQLPLLHLRDSISRALPFESDIRKKSCSVESRQSAEPGNRRASSGTHLKNTCDGSGYTIES